MYMVIYRNDYHGTFSVMGKGACSLEAARNLRCVSGDLVVDVRDYSIPNSTDWLWDWEIQAADKSYAYRCRGEKVDRTKGMEFK